VAAVNLSWVDFGSVPDWVEALGTSGALAFLAGQYRRDRIKARADGKAADAAKRDLDAAQARLVSVTWNWENSLRYGFTAAVDVANDSSGPIRNLVMIIEDPESGTSRLDEDYGAGSWVANRLAAGKGIRLYGRPIIQPPAPTDGNDHSGQDWLYLSHRLGVEFTDAAGIRWVQFATGVPERRLDLC
jgi:hypothetical protein